MDRMILLDRQRGCLLGLAIGDALGVPAEFKPQGSFEKITGFRGGGPFNLAPGEWTDDTSMALCLGDILLEGFDSTEQFAKKLHASFYRWWQHGHNSHNGRCFDIGNTTKSALHLGKTLIGGNPNCPKCKDYLDKCPVCGISKHYPWPPHRADEASNGSVMRLAAVPIRYARDHKKAIEMARLQGRVTHGNNDAIEACADLCALILDFFSGGRPAQSIHASLRGLPPEKVPSSGYVAETMSAAQWAVLNTENFADAVLAAVNLGDDADTVGAVAGMLAGALYGRSGIPEEWVTALAWSQRIDDMAVSLAAAGLVDSYADPARVILRK